MLSREELARLREVTASQGLMLESVNPDLVVHQGSPTKHPERGSRRSAPPASCASRSRAGSSSGIGETPEERVAALEALAEVHAEHGHLQEVILQNFVPHPRYYGAEPAQIADEAQRSRDARRGGADARLGARRSRSTTCACWCASAGG